MTGTLVQIHEMNGDFNHAEPPESKVDSIINDVISELAQVQVTIDIKDRTFPSKVSKKIQHNQLRNNRSIVLKYKSYSSHIESAYGTVEKNVVNGKQTALLILHDMYEKALHKFNIDVWEPDMDAIKQHADGIIDDVKTQLTKFLYKSSNINFTKEQMALGVDIVIAHAFVECYVLENPNDTD